MPETQPILEAHLNDFDPAVRARALRTLASVDHSATPVCDNVNLHVHTFFSYNAQGWSPSRVAWEAAKRGLSAVGIIDFDVLDGMSEFHAAGELLGLRTSVGVETRVFYSEYADKEIDSPGEPGVHYVDGVGFARDLPAGSPQAQGLARYRGRAQDRNMALVARINPHVPRIALDYHADVIPLSPGQCPTERHIVSAYLDKSQERFAGRALSEFWAQLLGCTSEAAEKLLANRATMEETIRTRLAKRGGLGYQQPTSATFPLMEDFYAWVLSCDAIPMESWLDGTSEGERDARRLLECSVGKGARALNIIPDRNWNIADPQIRQTKVANLRRTVELADAMELPIHIGTEVNRSGQPYADDLNGPVLREFKNTFRRGAMVLTGHTICVRFAGLSYASPAAETEFACKTDRNAFFAAVGALPPMTWSMADHLRAVGTDRGYSIIRDAVTHGHWPAPAAAKSQ